MGIFSNIFSKEEKSRILVVDDDAILRQLLSVKFNSAGFEVDTAEDGQQCLSKVGVFKPDIILLDFQMPVMNGVQVLEKLRSDPATKTIKVAFFTNYGESNPNNNPELDRKFAQDAGAIDFIRKTDDLNSIVEQVKNILNTNPAPAQ